MALSEVTVFSSVQEWESLETVALVAALNLTGLFGTNR